MNENRIVRLKRQEHLPGVTLGTLKVEWTEHAPILTLENPKRTVDKDNRIPEGTYNCKPYSGTKYKDVYIVENVPNRSAILIHWGNTEKDTEGCILIGNKKGNVNSDNIPDILESKMCYLRFRSLVGKEPFTLIVED